MSKPKALSEPLREMAKKLMDEPHFSVEVTEGGSAINLGDGSTEQRLEIWDALGANDTSFGSGLCHQIANLTDGEAPDQSAMNFALGFIRDVAPRDHTEALLALQMVATHVVAMQSARGILTASHLRSKEGSTNRMTKMTRTYIAQMEALKRYRAKASQTVRVERVEVKDGGQAIVGDVTHGGSELKNAH